MIKSSTILTLIVRPALDLLGPRYEGPAVEQLIIAIALQESGLRYRKQVGGPARGLWQFERGGVNGVLKHKASADLAAQTCVSLLYAADADTVHAAIADNDTLACIMARLLIFTDPAPLPATQDEGWDYYKRLWRPGKPSPERWSANWMAAGAAVKGNPK